MTINLEDLPEHTQFDICKFIREGSMPRFKGNLITLPNLLSARYTCVECKTIMNVSFYLGDVHNIVNRVRCKDCGKWAILHFMGTSFHHEINKIRGKIQTKLTDFPLTTKYKTS